MLDTQKSHCPYCGEPIELVIDASAGNQEYIEDCFVCCRPIVVYTSISDAGEAELTLRTEND